MIDLSNSRAAVVDEQISGGIDDHVADAIEFGRGGRSVVAAVTGDASSGDRRDDAGGMISTSRTLSLRSSTMNKSPDKSAATHDGSLNSAAVAGPLSPLKPAVPLPATVAIKPARAVHLANLLVGASGMNRSPAESTPTSLGL